MTCKFCNLKLEKEEAGFNWFCKNCNVFYNREDGRNASYFKEQYINGITYTLVFYSAARKTKLYKDNKFICILDGEISFDDLLKRIKTLEVFS